MSKGPITLDPVEVPTAGTAVPLSLATPQIRADTLIFEADAGNDGNIYWGGPNVSSENGNTLAPGQQAALTVDTESARKINLGHIYLDADHDGNKCRITYIAIP